MASIDGGGEMRNSINRGGDKSAVNWRSITRHQSGPVQAASETRQIKSRACISYSSGCVS